VIAEKLREIAAEPYRAVAAAKLGALYKHLSEEDRDMVDAALTEGVNYSAAETAAQLLDRLEEQRMRNAGTRVTKIQRELLETLWNDREYAFDYAPPAYLEACLDLYNRGLLLRAESSEGRKYRLTPEGWEIARVLCAP
jgi:hypothetical protein